MKRTLKLCTAALVLALALVMTAGAASFEHCADALNEMGLFNGTANGYELDRAATRAEAATMLVRLLGAEEEAQEMEYEAPFTDLDDWQKPYVQYLYTNGLTTGATATTFEPENLCDMQMFSTFLLRALGYNDAEGDFTYASAVTKAQEIGLADYANVGTGTFLRDNVVAMSYTALSLEMKDEDISLLVKLVDDGAIDADAAANTLAVFETYEAYVSANTALSDVTKLDIDAKVAADFKVTGEGAMSMELNGNIKMDMNEDDVNASVMGIDGALKLVIDGEELATEMSFLFADGVYYIEVEGQKIKMEMDLDEAVGSVSTMELPEADPISTIKNISVSGNTYSVTYADGALDGIVEMVMGAMEESLGAAVTNISIGEVTVKVTIVDGAVTGMAAELTYSAAIDGMTMEIDMDMELTINAVGDSVVITLPADLDSYVDFAEAMEALLSGDAA